MLRSVILLACFLSPLSARRLMRTQLLHPTLHHLTTRNLNEGFDSYNGIGCEPLDDERIACSIIIGDDEYEVQEICGPSGPDNTTLACEVCAANNLPLADGMPVMKLCYEFICSADALEAFADGDFSSACSCVKAEVNDEACSACEFCKGGAGDSYFDEGDEVEDVLFTPPMALECPHMENIESDCELTTTSSTAASGSGGGGGMSGGSKFGVVLLVIVVSALAIVYVVRRRRANLLSSAGVGGTTTPGVSIS